MIDCESTGYEPNDALQDEIDALAAASPRCGRHPANYQDLCMDCAREHVRHEMTGEPCPHCEAQPTSEEYHAEVDRQIAAQLDAEPAAEPGERVNVG